MNPCRVPQVRGPQGRVHVLGVEVSLLRPGKARTIPARVILSEAQRSRRICVCFFFAECKITKKRATSHLATTPQRSRIGTHSVTPERCHPERSVAKSKDPRLLLCGIQTNQETGLLLNWPLSTRNASDITTADFFPRFRRVFTGLRRGIECFHPFVKSNC
jgi:hypothetical protein